LGVLAVRSVEVIFGGVEVPFARERVMAGHEHRHAFTHFNARQREGLTVCSRRNLLKAGLAGIAGLTVPNLLRTRAEAAAVGHSLKGAKSVILLWMAGGPSQIDTWDPKPSRPPENRGPFGVVRTRLPGVLVCEHLPKQAAMLDRFTLIRSVDARHSNHEPNTVMQTGNLEAEARTNPRARHYPAIGAVVARHHGPNEPGMPGYAAFLRSRTHLAFAGYVGKRYEPFIANSAARLPVYDLVGKDTGRVSSPQLFQLPAGLSFERIGERRRLLAEFDRVRRGLDAAGPADALDRFGQQAVDLLTGRRMQEALDLSREPQRTR